MGTASTGTGTESWGVLDYEEWMFRETCALWLDRKSEFDNYDLHIRNAVEESALIHARQLCEIVLYGNRGDDIKLADLLSSAGMASIRTEVAALRAHYGNDRPSVPPSPRWTINKRLAHPTTIRETSHDYVPMISALRPFIDAVMATAPIKTELEKRRKLRASA